METGTKNPVVTLNFSTNQGAVFVSVESFTVDCPAQSRASTSKKMDGTIFIKLISIVLLQIKLTKLGDKNYGIAVDDAANIGYESLATIFYNCKKIIGDSSD